MEVIYEDGPERDVTNLKPKTRFISLRIRRNYFDEIVVGKKSIELRKNTPFWYKRLVDNGAPKIAVFVCGKDVHRRRITMVGIGTPEVILGRPLSEQGRKDIPTRTCIAIHLGKQLQCRDCALLGHQTACKECAEGGGWLCGADKSGKQHVHPDMMNCGAFVLKEGWTP
jgi:hypothetical protein